MELADVYKKCHDAKDKYPDSFNDWIREFLHFCPPSLIQTDLKRFEEIMDPEKSTITPSSKRLHKYSASQYIFYYMDDNTPGTMTNRVHIAEDAEFWVKFFNIDFFNVEDPKTVLYSFVHGLNMACDEAGINYLDVSKKLFKLFFDLNNFDFLENGPSKSRFLEYYIQKMGVRVGKNPNRTLIISEEFFKSFDSEPDKKERLQVILRSDPPPSKEDYNEVVKILELKEKNSKRLWTDDKFSIYRSNDRAYIYLVREDDGKVWKVYSDKTSVRDILSEYRALFE